MTVLYRFLCDTNISLTKADSRNMAGEESFASSVPLLFADGTSADTGVNLEPFKNTPKT